MGIVVAQRKPWHPFAAIFPFRDDDSLTELSDHMKKHGQLDEIVLLDGQVIEGRRRQEAAIRADLKPRYREFGSRPGDGTDPLEFSFAVNFQRRSMTEAERVVAAVAFSQLKRGRPKKDDEPKVTQKAGKTNNPPNGGITPGPESPSGSTKEAAEKFGVKVRQIERAKAVIEKATPEVVEAMKSEAVSVSDAASVCDESPDVQRKALDAVKNGESKTLKGAVEAMSGPAPETAAMVSRDLERLIVRAERIETKHRTQRDQVVGVLRSVVAVLGKL